MEEENGYVKVSKEEFQQLLSNFWEAAGHCEELDIGEDRELDEDLSQRKEWTKEKFGRKIDEEMDSEPLLNL